MENEYAEYHDHFVGTEKIRGIEEKDGKLVVMFKNNTVQTIPKILLRRLVTKEKNESGGGFRDMRVAAIAQDLVDLLTDVYDVRYSEINTIFSSVGTVLSHNHEAADATLWGKFTTQVTLADIKRVLLENVGKTKAVKEGYEKDNEAQELSARARARVASMMK